jgi:undecaprenyl-diphosphatase
MNKQTIKMYHLKYLSVLLSDFWPSWILPIRSSQFLALLVSFVILTIVVMSGSTSGIDNIVSRYFKSIQGNENLDTLMIIVTTFGDVVSLVIVAIILTIIRRTRKIGMIFLISVVIITILIMYIKPVVGRPIPPYGFESKLHLSKNFKIEDDSPVPFARDLSYPSNHVAQATAFAFIVGFALNKRSRVIGLIMWFFPIIISITRLYVMQHYLTDLVGGFLLGLIISIVLSNVMRLEEPFMMSRFKGKEDQTKTY